MVACMTSAEPTFLSEFSLAPPALMLDLILSPLAFPRVLLAVPIPMELVPEELLNLFEDCTLLMGGLVYCFLLWLLDGCP